MRYVVGLGNPGGKYSRTRHNLGWMVLDELAATGDYAGERERWQSLTVAGPELTLVKPLTFMNDSGRAVAALMRRTGSEPQDILAVLDDLNLSLGTLRLRPGGSAGGHNGLRSIEQCIGTADYPRLRLGIGPRPTEVDGRKFVLSRFHPSELTVADAMVAQAARAALCWAREGVEEAMSRYNGPVEEAGEEEKC